MNFIPIFVEIITKTKSENMKVITLKDKFISGKFKNKTIENVIQSNNTKYLTYFLKKNEDTRLDSAVIKLAQNSVELKFNKKLIDILTHINSNTSKQLLELNKNTTKSIFTNIKATKVGDVITFDTPFTTKKNSTIKVGRFVKKLFELNDIKITDVEVEEFTTDFFASSAADKNLEIKIVKGEDIRKYYHTKNYLAQTGSLGNSCMKHDHCQDRMDLYVNNKDVAMLVLVDKKTQLVTARAIVWEKTTFKFIDNSTKTTMNKPFMDRVYVNSNKHTKVFFEHAKKMNWMYKKQQSFSNKVEFIYNESVYVGQMHTHLDEITNNPPYLDTMSFRCGDYDNTLTNGYVVN